MSNEGAVWLDARFAGYGEALALSGLDDRQLRQGLDRNVLCLGEKLRTGRWRFSIRELFSLTIIGGLVKGTYIPISYAAQIAETLCPSLEFLLAKADKFNGDMLEYCHPVAIIFYHQSRMKVFIEHDGEVITVTDPVEADFEGWKIPHIRFSMGFSLSSICSFAISFLPDPPRIMQALARLDVGDL